MSKKDVKEVASEAEVEETYAEELEEEGDVDVTDADGTADVEEDKSEACESAAVSDDDWDCDLAGYEAPQFVEENVYKLKVRGCDKDTIEWNDKKTGEPMSAKVYKMFITIEESEYTNPVPIYLTLFLPKAGQDAKAKNAAQGKIIKFKEAVGHADAAGNGFESSQVLGAEFYGLVGVRLMRNSDRSEHFIKRYMDGPL